MFDAIDHIVIAVRDLEAATQTYTRMFDTSPWWRGRHPQLGTENVLFRLENTSIELLAGTHGGAAGGVLGGHLKRHGEGLFAIAFATADARRCGELLRSHGLTASDPVAGEGHDEDGDEVRRWRCVYLPEEQTRGVRLFAIERDASAPSALKGQGGACAAARLDHVVLMSADGDACIDLYRDRLGMRLALDRRFEDRGVRLLFFRIGATTLEVATALNSQPAATDRLWGLAYGVEDVEQAAERLSSQGFDVSAVRTGEKPGTRVFTVRRETHGVATLFIGSGKGS